MNLAKYHNILHTLVLNEELIHKTSFKRQKHKRDGMPRKKINHGALQSVFIHWRNTTITSTLSTQNFLFTFKVLYIHFLTILDLLPLLAFSNPRNRLNYNDDYHVLQHNIHTSGVVARSSSNTLFVFSWKTSSMKRLRQVFFSHLPSLLT